MNTDKSVKQKKTPLEAGRIPREEIQRLRMRGCLQDRKKQNTFKIRVITRNGEISAEEYSIISEAVERFGSGSVRISSKLTVDIQGVPYDKIYPLLDFLAVHGLMTGGTGPELKPIMACNGTDCRFGLTDTLGLADQLHNRFYTVWKGVILPHKFKIVVGGCPNNCMQPGLSDLGIVGQKIPLADSDKCRACKKCQPASICPVGAISVSSERKIPVFPSGTVKNGKNRVRLDTTACIHCGRCLGKCPFGVFEEYRQGYQVMIGGHGGRKMVQARPLSKIIFSEERLMDLVEKALLLYQKEGLAGERFADTIDRLGFKSVEKRLTQTDQR